MAWTENDIPDQTGRVAVVTGSNTGLGFDTARALAEHGATVVMAVRDRDKGASAADRIRASAAPGSRLDLVTLDLGSLQSVREAADAIGADHPRIDILVDNAGVMIPPHSRTADGFELQFGTNFLGHFAFTAHLMPALHAADAARVVIVSSNAHKLGGRIHFDDLQFEEKYSRSAAYAQSKLATLMFAYQLDRRLRAARSPVLAVAAHPGFTDSELMRHVWAPARPFVKLAGPWLGQTPQQGALPQLLAATAPFVEGGQYWGPDGLGELKGSPTQVRSSARSRDLAVQERLWAVAEELTGVTFPA